MRTTDPTDITLGETLASAFAEASELVREATERAVQSNLAVADSAFSDVASASQARKRAYLAPVLSRGHAADLALGGPTANEVMHPSTAEALPALGGQPLGILAQPADPGVDAALQVIREAAPDPRVIMDEAYSLDDLIRGHVPRGNLRVRLRELYAVDPGASTDEFLQTFGLERRHLLLARQKMQEQIRAFHRSMTQRAPARQVLTATGTTDTRFKRYAATSTIPQQLPSAYWSNLALQAGPHSGDPTLLLAGTAPRPTPAYALRGSAQSLDYAISVASELLQNPDDLVIGTGADAPTEPHRVRS